MIRAVLEAISSHHIRLCISGQFSRCPRKGVSHHMGGQRHLLPWWIDEIHNIEIIMGDKSQPCSYRCSGGRATRATVATGLTPIITQLFGLWFCFYDNRLKYTWWGSIWYFMLTLNEALITKGRHTFHSAEWWLHWCYWRSRICADGSRTMTLNNMEVLSHLQ